MLRGELVMEHLSNGSLEGLLHHALCLCDCRSVALTACETADHPSSDECEEGMGKNQLPQWLLSPHHSGLAMHLSLFSYN